PAPWRRGRTAVANARQWMPTTHVPLSSTRAVGWRRRGRRRAGTAGHRSRRRSTSRTQQVPRGNHLDETLLNVQRPPPSARRRWSADSQSVERPSASWRNALELRLTRHARRHVWQSFASLGSDIASAFRTDAILSGGEPPQRELQSPGSLVEARHA